MVKYYGTKLLSPALSLVTQQSKKITLFPLQYIAELSVKNKAPIFIFQKITTQKEDLVVYLLMS